MASCSFQHQLVWLESASRFHIAQNLYQLLPDLYPPGLPAFVGVFAARGIAQKTTLNPIYL
jgi:hypothetical protein